ncbi:uncharacterized protein SCHCODRAFT_02493467 [Schizophyllum commune H4-8]|nr:uncharacterized protein SCHCODRAFT_02493467 [Schizophyllum commune H4-8]KAI5896150.1 hypothetical protein SCHCODRAFT_02493467 [Schizophyllum commune H4-8]
MSFKNEKSESQASLLPKGGQGDNKPKDDKKPVSPSAGVKSTSSDAEFAKLAKKHGWGSTTPSGASLGG